MKLIIAIVVLIPLVCSNLLSQQVLPSPPPGDPGILARLTTPISINFLDGTKSEGTGFFFFVLAPDSNPATGPHWVQIQKTYVITNRHVIKLDKLESLVDFTFNLRKDTPTGVEWLPIHIAKKDLLRLMHIVPDSPIDVAAIDVSELVNSTMQNAAREAEPGRIAIEAINAVSKYNFPGSSMLSINSGDDVIVIGYPRLFIDKYNKLPILKRGLLITPWGMKYDGSDDFLVDYKGFSGSSGSIVVSQPTDLIVKDNRMYTNGSKDFLFLGIYSGEPYIPGDIKDLDNEIVQEKVKVDVGQVWYYYTVQQTIDSPSIEERSQSKEK